MRKLIKLAVVALGIRAFLHWRRSRRAHAAVPSATAADPAEELRRKLAESRADDAPSAQDAPAPEASVAARRADVHDQARATIGEMTPSDEA